MFMTSNTFMMLLIRRGIPLLMSLADLAETVKILVASPTSLFTHSIHPLHPGLLFTLTSIPIFYTLGLFSGNVSWVDRAWPFFPVLCSGMVVGWTRWNPRAAAYQTNVPRLNLMLFLQIVWSLRLTGNAIRRGFYDWKGEDYRYTVFRKLVPKWFFQIIHVLVIATSQPLLLFALSVPLNSALTVPPSPINAADIVLVLSGLWIVFTEMKADDAMQAYQNSKHNSKSNDIVRPSRESLAKTNPKHPQPASYPRSHHPGFMTEGLWKWSRHPNFAAEQLFWVNQALFVVSARYGARSHGASRQRTQLSFWPVFGPCFALSLLFCASTTLTEWITTKKYPAYRSYKKLVGQFLPQETALVRIWRALVGGTRKANEDVNGVGPSS